MTAQIMAIINTSPDSFSGDGIKNGEELKARIQQAVDEGADILDIGGQSTRPGAAVISESEEITKTIPAIQLARSLCDLPISIDTFKPAVARAALEAGATIINDIHGGENPEMIEVAKQFNCEVVVMHSRGTPETMGQLTDYSGGVVNEVLDFLQKQADLFIAAGVERDKIIIDPGIGFAKTAAQSFELTRELDAFKKLGFRVLYGASRKSFLGKALGNEVGQRQTATTATTVYALLHGADIIRVHDVKAAVEARRIVECILDPEKVS